MPVQVIKPVMVFVVVSAAVIFIFHVPLTGTAGNCNVAPDHVPLQVPINDCAMISLLSMFTDTGILVKLDAPGVYTFKTSDAPIFLESGKGL